MRYLLLCLLCVPAALAGEVTLLRVPDGGIQPQIAVDGSGTVHLLYFSGAARGGDLRYARLGQDGKFGPAVRVNSQANSAIAIGTVRGAHIAAGQGGRVHVAWMGSQQARPRGPSDAAPMLYTRSDKAGKNFEPQRNVLQAAAGLDGGGSLAADGKGHVYVAWHAGPPKEREAGRRVWLARSTDGGKTFARERPAVNQATGTCACCGMRAFCDARRNVYLLYRGCMQKTERDMFLLWSTDQGRRFKGKRVDGWKVGQCVMSTASLAPGGTDEVLLAWETRGQVNFARFDPRRGKLSGTSGAPGPGEGRKHPVVARNAKGELLLAWTEGTGWNRGGSLHWQRYDAKGRPTGAPGRRDGVPTWSVVAAYARPGGGFVVLY